LKKEPDDGYVCQADRVFDGRSVREGYSVVVRKGLVAAVVSQARTPSDLPLVEMPGCTIIPGLIDCHVHFMRWQGSLYLAAGVTTIRDTGNDLDWILDCRKEWRDRDWPRILCTGPMVDGPKSGWGISRCCPDAESSARIIGELASRGVDAIKIYASFPLEWLPSALAAAGSAGLPTCMHPLSADMVSAAAAGVEEFFHLDGLMDRLWPDHPPGWLDLWGDPHVSEALKRQRETADRIAELGSVITPTLSYYRSRQEIVGDPSLLPSRARSWFVKVFEELDEHRAEWRRALASVQGFVGLLAERGVPILSGTDVPWVLPGQSIWTEMSLLAESGLGPIGALESATSLSAEHLRLPRAGVLEEGAYADLVFVRGDPTRSVPENPEVPLVVRGGRIYRTADLVIRAKEEDADPREDPWGKELLHRSGSREKG